MRGRLQRVTERWHSLPRWVRWPLWAGFGAFGLLVVLAVGLWLTVDLPDEPPAVQAAVLVAADGQELAVLSEGELRYEVTLDQVAPVMVDAVVAAEDRRFYGHSGIDPIGITRAAWRNTIGGGTQGGSTLTQQLVKNSYTDGDRSLWRKAREAVLAMKLEQTTDKDEILERYLNIVYFGRGVYGVEAAARIYFDTSAAALTTSQAALLAGLLRAPETADPVEAPEEATRRRQTVLDAMVETGVLAPDAAAAAAAEPLGAIPPTPATRLTAGLAPHFVEWVQAEATAAVGEAALYRDGLRVVTTLDLNAQRAAEAAVAEILNDPADPHAALVALDTDGSVRAHVGSRDYAALQVDVVRGSAGGGAGRQAGSTFKPFVLAPALAGGTTLGERFTGPSTITVEVDGEPWEVDNYGEASFGALTLEEATAQSVNTVYAQLLERVGPAAVADAAQALGIESDLVADPSIALGTSDVSPLEMASAYLTLANDGRRVDPHPIVRIETADGRVVWEPDLREPTPVLDEGVARAVNYALQGVIDHGTGTAADIDRPAAGKTGTTQENVDAWFAGYVPGYSAVVWMGYPDASVPMVDVHGETVTGGSFPAEIWQRYMSAALEGREAAEFAPPPEELLRGEPVTLTLSPPAVTPGAAFTASGSGFGTCTAAWSVSIEGTPVASAPDVGSDAEDRSAQLVVPADLAPGIYRVVATCDSGGGPQEAAAADLTVQDTGTTTTTTPSTTSSTTQPGPPTSPPGRPTTTTTRPTTTTSTAPPTTAAGADGDGAGGG